MSRNTSNQTGFGIIGIVLAVVAVVVLGGAGYFVYKAHNKKTPISSATTGTSSPSQTTTTTQNKSSSATPAITSADLISVAKQVYDQIPADSNNPPTVGGCGGRTISSCPFTASLASKINAAPVPAYAQGPGAVLVPGFQNGPFGTLSYSATPSTQGGTATVTLTPNTSAKGPAITWKLIIVQSSGKLLVNDIVLTRGAGVSRPACGPIKVYNYTSCPN